MSESLTFKKIVFVAAWDDDVVRRSLVYWRGRNFRFDDVESNPIKGCRGSFWGNLTSFDMSKLRATLTIDRKTLDNSSSTVLAQIEFIMAIDTAMQDITEWNEAYWLREMEAVERWILYSDGQEVEWQEFNEQWRCAAWRWALTLGQGGRKIKSPPND